MKVTVLSTGNNTPPGASRACVESVRAQFRGAHGTDVEHIIREGPTPHFANLVEVIGSLPDDRIVACVDHDDWLGPPSALVTHARRFAAGALVTYGSFVFADGRRGEPSTAYGPDEDVRRAPWKATHLKCFRAGLFKRIKHEHLKGADGQWLEHARDLALMLPMLEMAGPERRAHVQEVCYVYNFANSTEMRGDADTRRAELACVRYVRALPPYEVIS